VISGDLVSFCGWTCVQCAIRVRRGRRGIMIEVEIASKVGRRIMIGIYKISNKKPPFVEN